VVSSRDRTYCGPDRATRVAGSIRPYAAWEGPDACQLTPGKIEMIGGKILGSDKDCELLPGVLLENVGGAG
jgi:hypothetical protein